jgi:superfamily II DNA or RNA helicase
MDSYKTILYRKGYLVNKKLNQQSLIDSIKRDLTVKPFTRINYNQKQVKYPVYLENKKFLFIPKYYGIEKLGEPEFTNIQKPTKINLKFKGDLKKTPSESFDDDVTQHEITIEILKNIKKTNGGIICLPPGFGKTVVTLYILTKLGFKTLVVVHKTFLMDQWKERIQKFIPDARIGTIQQDKVDIKDKDIVLGMLQSISMKEYNDTIFNDFGVVVIDEVHHISSRVFSRALPKISCQYSIGLSATPERDDKLERIFYWYLGPTLYKINDDTNENVIVRVYNYHCRNQLYREVINKWTKYSDVPTMVTNISLINERNEFVLNMIKSIKENEKNRRILILSGRLAHLDYLLDIFSKDKKYKDKIGLYIGGMKHKELDKSAKKELIFSTYDMSSEALDIPELDTIILSTPPKGKIRQSTGRILRKDSIEYEYPPLIIDIVDDIKSFKNSGYLRRRYYKKSKYNIRIYNVDPDDNSKITEDTKKTKEREEREEHNKVNEEDDMFIDSD